MRGFGKLVAAGVLGGTLSVAAMAQSPATPSADSGCTAVDSAGCAKLARTVPPLPTATEGSKTVDATQPVPTTNAQPETEAAASAPVAAKTLEIPAGTKVLLTIRSAINTKTAQAGDGVYLQSSFPVIANGRAVIPAGVYVQGVVDSVERHIRIKGPAKLTMHFTSIIFPNGSVVEIPGQVNSLPGSDGPKVKGDEGTVQQSSSVGDVAKAAGQGAAIGAGVGGISGGVNGHPVEGLRAWSGGRRGGWRGGFALYTRQRHQHSFRYADRDGAAAAVGAGGGKSKRAGCDRGVCSGGEPEDADAEAESFADDLPAGEFGL